MTVYLAGPLIDRLQARAAADGRSISKTAAIMLAGLLDSAPEPVDPVDLALSSLKPKRSRQRSRCEHGVPADSYCKRCNETAVVVGSP